MYSPVSVEAKLSFVEPRYYENLHEDVKNLRRSLTVI